jgi:tetratricopeptide (TPR) repeat protein
VHFQEALRLKLDYPDAHNNLGVVLTRAGRIPEAIEHYQEALRLKPELAEARYNLGDALTKSGRIPEAIELYQQALRLSLDSPNDLNSLAWLYATQPEAKFRNGQEAVRLAERACELTKDGSAAMLDTLAAAYAETGRFDDAAKVARKALDVAVAAGKNALAKDISERLRSYEAGRPWHEPSKQR